MRIPPHTLALAAASLNQREAKEIAKEREDFWQGYFDKVREMKPLCDQTDKV